jgi:hypothetical protein
LAGRSLSSGLIGRLTVILALLGSIIAVTLAQPAREARADCAFPFTPTTYEDLKNRELFLSTIDLAAFNMLFPGEPYFGLPDLEYGPRDRRLKEPGLVPPVLLKSIGWIESSITQSATEVPFGAIGPSLISFDCGHGIAQVTSGMTLPAGESGRGSPEQALVATHFAYNIARGAYILADKWNQAPEEKPIAGTDTNGHPKVLENWYYAIWAYNGFTGPGANRSNHPMDPIYGSWPRPAFSCGATGDGKSHNRGNYPYQELVLGCAANPPIVDNKPLWSAQAISLPDLNDDKWKDALKLENFVFPYAKMDIPSPQPVHIDNTAKPSSSTRNRVLGAPKLELSKKDVKVGFAPNGGSTVETVDIQNSGTGVLAWYAIPSVPWLIVTPYTGAAIGDNLPCEKEAPCERPDHLEISVDAAKAPAGKRTVQVTVQMLGSAQSTVINVQVSQVMRIGVPGVSRN